MCKTRVLTDLAQEILVTKNESILADLRKKDVGIMLDHMLTGGFPYLVTTTTPTTKPTITPATTATTKILTFDSVKEMRLLKLSPAKVVQFKQAFLKNSKAGVGYNLCLNSRGWA